MFVAEPQPEIEHVAIMPCKAPTDAARALFTYLVVLQLGQSGRYELIEPSAIADELQLPELALAAFTSEQAIEVGALLGVDAVVVGTVSRFENANRERNEGAIAEFSLHLLDCSNGKTVWSSSLLEQAASPELKLSEHADHVVQKLMAGLAAKLPPLDTAALDVKPVEEESVPAVDVIVQMDEGDRVQLTTPMRAVTPTGLRVAKLDLREVSLAWDKPDGRPRVYRVERSTSPRGEFEVLAEVAPRRKFYRDFDNADSALHDNTTYYYRLVAVRKDGVESHPTKPLEVALPPAPEPPSEIVAHAPDSRLVELEWEPPESPGVVSYVVERAMASDAGRFEEVDVVNTPVFRDEGTAGRPLGDNVEYVYRIRTVNRVGAVSEGSEPVHIVTLPVPDAVRNMVVVDRGVRCVPLSWTLNPETNVVSYKVYRSDTENGEFELLKAIGGRTNTRFVDGGGVPGNLPDDQTYYYVVHAVNAVGAEGPGSEVIRATTRGRPPVVRHVEAVSDLPREARLTWEESPDDKVQGYEIWRAVGNHNNFTLIGKTSRRESNTYSDRGGTRRRGLGLLLDGEHYRYKVLAFNTADVQSDWSAIASATTKEAPRTPMDVRSTTELPRSIEVTWRANPELDIETYLVEIANQASGRSKRIEQVPAKAEVASLEFLHEDLADGDERYYRVKAVDATGLESDWSDMVQGQAKPAPETPRNLHAVTGDRSVRLSWDPPPQADIREYRIWTRVLLSWELLDTTEGTEYELPPMEQSKRSTICISSVDHDGLESLRSSVVKTEPARLR